MNKYAGALLIICALFIIAATTDNQTGKFENLKVLPKDITVERLDSVMNTFAISLGVKCSFCHAWKDSVNKKLDFASDKKEEKEVARYMYKMTAGINSSYFNPYHSNQTDTIHAVICYTCHRGSSEVDSKLFLAKIDSTIQQMVKNRKKKIGK